MHSEMSELKGDNNKGHLNRLAPLVVLVDTHNHTRAMGRMGDPAPEWYALRRTCFKVLVQTWKAPVQMWR